MNTVPPSSNADFKPRALVSGGTGFIGSALVRRLLALGWSVSVITRDVKKCKRLFGDKVAACEYSEELPHSTSIDAVVNLAGAPIGPIPWTNGRKRSLLASRLDTTKRLLDLVTRLAIKPQVWVQASAIGYYGIHEMSRVLTESAEAGTGFAAGLCKSWEALAYPMQEMDIRLCTLRFGLVLGRGGALHGLLLPLSLGMGGKIGNGQQPFSWIHHEDAVDCVIACINNKKMRGIYNVVAPEVHTQETFMRSAGDILRRPVWLTIPALPIRLLMGEMSQLFLDGQHVVSARLQEQGFPFQYPDLRGALINILK